MSALVSPKTWQWSPEVLDFAARNNVADYLEPLLEATRRVYPSARDLKVFVEQDRELRDVWAIVFDVSVPQADVPDYVKARRRWGDELFRICPAPLACTFVLTLIPVA